MARFVSNRRWTFILALGIGLVWCAIASFVGGGSWGLRDANATQITDIGYGDGGGDGGGGTTIGDPDLPSGKTSKASSNGGKRGSTTLEARAAGDSKTSSSVGLWRLRVALESLRGFYFRF